MANSKDGTFLGHPKGLYILFFTEMWERFSYYGMRALLVLYLVNYFKWTQEEASKTYKWYTSLVYLTPLIGGYVADRYIGNRMAIVIGALLMAIGHFLMAFPDISVFYAALGFLIMGNGFFKPNMSVQVGRLYPQNDPRRDGAYTIFYMGINLGAFLSPIVCGALRDTPGLGFHWGFGAAGVGMVLGLLVYLVGQPWIKELPEGTVYHDPDRAAVDEAPGGEKHVLSEDEAETARSRMPRFAAISPALLVAIGIVTLVVAPLLWHFELLSFDNWVSAYLAAISFFFGAWILSKLKMAVRDRVIAIYILSVFVVFFWSAFEQAGNAMNVWADQTTNRYVVGEAPVPSIYPDVPVDLEKQGFWPTIKIAFAKPFSLSPVLTTSFQSINALAIVLMAPVFAWLWLFLARRHTHLSIAAKMAIGVFFQGVAFALMIWAAHYEGGASQTNLSTLPRGVVMAPDGVGLAFFDAPALDTDSREKLDKYLAGEHDGKPMPAHGGRLVFDAVAGTLNIKGVLDENHRDRILRATVPPDYVEFAYNMAIASQKEKEVARGTDKDKFELVVKLDHVPPGFEAKYLRGFEKDVLEYDAETQSFHVHDLIADKDYKQILVAGSDPQFRAALNNLYQSAAKYKVSSWWLVWFYVLCTIGELCLSPVGLSMVSKLSPRRFATMLMGMWLLTSFFGNYTAGLAGESWERLAPGSYFLYVTLAMFGASVVCFLVARKVTQMMHGVE